MLIRKEGAPYIAASGILSLLLVRTRLKMLGLAPLAFVTWFFRDPPRDIPQGAGLFLSPADGTILDVVETTEEKVGSCTKVAIFMSVFNVHVNRAPVEGVVIEKVYKPGKFHMANVGKKTEANERMTLYIENYLGIFRVDQVAGLVARRIHCWPEKGDTVRQGERIGLIRFGSLLESFIPQEVKVIVSKGDKVYAGQTILGRVLS
jgi:phosphatidylserine decarboxylase